MHRFSSQSGNADIHETAKDDKRCGRLDLLFFNGGKLKFGEILEDRERRG